MEEVRERIAALPARQRAELLRRLRGTGNPMASWIVPMPARPAAAVRLFCLPYAGGGAAVFRSWGAALGDTVEVCAVQPPGREARIGEPAYKRMGPLVAALAAAIEAHLDRPFAFYGHSMGALIAFELARHLRRTGRPQPVRLLLAAYRAPQLPNPNIKIYHLPDEVLKAVLHTDGTPARILANDELMRAALPTLRADFELCDTYEYAPEEPLACPLTVFGGAEDVRVSAADLQGWREHSAIACSIIRLPGGHFFVHSAQDQLLAEVARHLRGDLAVGEGESHG